MGWSMVTFCQNMHLSANLLSEKGSRKKFIIWNIKTLRGPQGNFLASGPSGLLDFCGSDSLTNVSALASNTVLAVIVLAWLVC